MRAARPGHRGRRAAWLAPRCSWRWLLVAEEASFADIDSTGGDCVAPSCRRTVRATCGPCSSAPPFLTVSTHRSMLDDVALHAGLPSPVPLSPCRNAAAHRQGKMIWSGREEEDLHHRANSAAETEACRRTIGSLPSPPSPLAVEGARAGAFSPSDEWAPHVTKGEREE